MMILENFDDVLFQSFGTFHYTSSKLIVLVDPEISRYYRWYIPRWLTKNPQRYAPHISVVRNEVPSKKDFWMKYQGEKIEFQYSNIIHMGQVYYWLNVFSKRLEEVRLELELPVSTQFTRPPEGFVKCFHLTLGNKKPN